VIDEPMDTKTLSAQRDAVAPDGSDVRILLEVGGGGMAHFELGPCETAIAIKHRTVEEIWYFLTGRGQMWRMAADGEESIVDVGPGVSISIPLGRRSSSVRSAASRSARSGPRCRPGRAAVRRSVPMVHGRRPLPRARASFLRRARDAL
jgi:mannose-6-phosphate isomerase-like protein (cupin superfamily)